MRLTAGTLRLWISASFASTGICSDSVLQPCAGSAGSFSSEALELDSSWALTLTVPSSTGDVNVCAQVEDFAGNVGERVLVRLEVEALADVAHEVVGRVEGLQEGPHLAGEALACLGV